MVQVEHISDSDSDSAVSSAMEVGKNYLETICLNFVKFGKT